MTGKRRATGGSAALAGLACLAFLVQSVSLHLHLALFEHEVEDPGGAHLHVRADDGAFEHGHGASDGAHGHASDHGQPEHGHDHGAPHGPDGGHSHHPASDHLDRLVDAAPASLRGPGPAALACSSRAPALALVRTGSAEVALLARPRPLPPRRGAPPRAPPASA